MQLSPLTGCEAEAVLLRLLYPLPDSGSDVGSAPAHGQKIALQESAPGGRTDRYIVYGCSVVLDLPGALQPRAGLRGAHVEVLCA
jgi:hypothetical protein